MGKKIKLIFTIVILILLGNILFWGWQNVNSSQNELQRIASIEKENSIREKMEREQEAAREQEAKIQEDLRIQEELREQEEWERMEEQRKQEEAKKAVESRNPVKVKGIYVTGPRAGSGEAMDQLIQLVEDTELNALVIDIKNDSGEITYKMDSDTVKEIGAGVAYVQDMEELIRRLKEKNIYLIARIVAFKDPILAKEKPGLSLKLKNGKPFKDAADLRWVNPYNKKVWDYLIEVSKEAVELGFDEIQFDYIRFSTYKSMKDVDFGNEAKSKTKEDIINEFVSFASEQLKPLGVYVSADVYGTVISNEVDQKIIGQNYGDMAEKLDYICPMIYPSHYADGSYEIKHPDLEPYQLILKALEDSKNVLTSEGEPSEKATVRPWLQDFTAKWIQHYTSYGEKEIKAQIKAVYDAGYEEWILWNGMNRYTKEGLLVED